MQESTTVDASKLSFLEINEKKNRSDQAKVLYYTAEYQAASMANQADRDSCEASNKLYIGGKEHWTPESIDYLASMERGASTYNVAKVELDKVIGQIINNPHKSKYAAINQDDVSKTNIMDTLYEMDENRGKFKKQWNKFVKDVIIHTGVYEMYVDYRHSRLGNISRRTLNRVKEIEWDRNWKSDDVGDLRFIFKYTWKTAREIKEEWNTKSDVIDQNIRIVEEISTGANTEADIGDYISQDSLYVDSNSRYKVIEVSYMQKVAKTKKNADKLAEFNGKNANPDITIGQTNSPLVAPEYDSICKVITFAPGVGIGLVLDEGDHPVQIGRLPYFIASSDVTNGVRQGIATGMIDAQI